MRELLEEALEFLGNPYFGVDGQDLYERIRSELAGPEPEPVAWIFPKGLERLNSRGTFTSATLFAKQDECLVPLYTNPPAKKTRSLAEYNETPGIDELAPIEKLRFFCSIAMSNQDWLDVEPFFDAIESA